MKIGVPKEVKVHEYRVGLTPESVGDLVDDGHAVFVESGAGEGIGCDDARYARAGAQILHAAPDVFAAAELIVKVKEPQAQECLLLTARHTLFTYLHLAADREQTEALLRSKAVCIAYETVRGANGTLPLLMPMSEVAGRMAIQVAASCLQKTNGGAGRLLGGVPGTERAHVVVIGGGTSGTEAARMAIGLGARVTVLDRSVARLRCLEDVFGPRAQMLYSTRSAVEQFVAMADVVVGSVLVPGAGAPKVVSRKMLSGMRRGAVIVDIAIDQGGCFESSRPTTHADPTYWEGGVVHYCVTNMPGAVPETSTYALNNATLPYVRRLAGAGVTAALAGDERFLAGLNVCRGALTEQAVADTHKMAYVPPAQALRT